MKQYLLEYDVLLGIAAFCCICMALQSITAYLYIHLIHESKKISQTKNRWLRSLAARMEACYQLRIPPKNVEALVRNGIYRYEFMGISLIGWRNLCRQFNGLAVVLSACNFAVGSYYGMSEHWFFVNGISISVWLIMLFVYGVSCQMQRREEVLSCYIVDYLENTLMPRLENEYLHEEATRAYRQEYFREADLDDDGDYGPEENESIYDGLVRGSKESDMYDRLARDGKEGGVYAKAARDGEEGRVYDRLRDEEEVGVYAKAARDGEEGRVYAKLARDGKEGGVYAKLARDGKEGGVYDRLRDEEEDGTYDRLARDEEEDSMNGRAVQVKDGSIYDKSAYESEKNAASNIAQRRVSRENVMPFDSSVRKKMEKEYGQAAGLIQEIVARMAEEEREEKLAEEKKKAGRQRLVASGKAEKEKVVKLGDREKIAATKELSDAKKEVKRGVHVDMDELLKQVEREKGRSVISSAEQLELLEEVIKEYM